MRPFLICFVSSSDDEPIVSTTSVNVEAVDKDTERIYAGMDSLAAEEEGAVDAHTEPTSVISPALPVSKANGTGKREREEEEESMRLPPVNGNGVEATQTREHIHSFQRDIHNHNPKYIDLGRRSLQKATRR